MNRVEARTARKPETEAKTKRIIKDLVNASSVVAEYVRGKDGERLIQAIANARKALGHD